MRDCELFGIDPAAFARPDPVQKTAKDIILIWPDMADAVALFFDAPWQWVSLGLGGTMRTNIIRTELEATARLLGVTTTPAIFADIRVMEDEALKTWSRKSG